MTRKATGDEELDALTEKDVMLMVLSELRELNGKRSLATLERDIFDR
jgi:hypothetical protein